MVAGSSFSGEQLAFFGRCGWCRIWPTFSATCRGSLLGGGLALSLGGMVLLQGWIFRERGGKIQKVVTSKTSTLDVRSATFVDLLYALVLLFFKLDILKIWPEKLPMSTTWVFLGLLAGREIGLALRLKQRTRGQVSKLIFLDAGKALLGSVIAIALALLLPVILKMVT